MKLSPWFCVGISGPPVRSGIYEFELWIHVRDRSEYTRIECKAFYSHISNHIALNGRIIYITTDDQWRGIVPNWTGK